MSVSLPDPSVAGPVVSFEQVQERLRQCQRNFEALASDALPAFTPLPWMFSTAPSGWLLIAGQAVTDKHPMLRRALLNDGSPHGVSGSDPLLPDMRGAALIGAGTGTGLTPRALGAQVGTETHVLTVAQLAAHAHPGSTVDVRGANESGVLGGSTPIASTGGATTTKAVAVGSQGGGQAHPNMQPSIALNWIVRAA